MKETTTSILIIIIIFCASACVKLTTYEGTEINDNLLKSNTKVNRIILHADFIKASNDILQIRPFFIEALEKSLKIRGNKDFEIIVKKKGEKLPDFMDNKGAILITGDIWSMRTQRKGNLFEVKRLSQITNSSRRSWDVLESVDWHKESLLSYTNLFFIEFSNSPKMLRSSITVSSREIEHIAGNQGSKKDFSRDRFEIFDPDSENNSFFTNKSTGKRIAIGYKLVSWDSSIRRLAELSVAKHIDEIF